MQKVNTVRLQRLTNCSLDMIFFFQAQSRPHFLNSLMAGRLPYDGVETNVQWMFLFFSFFPTKQTSRKTIQLSEIMDEIILCVTDKLFPSCNSQVLKTQEGIPWIPDSTHFLHNFTSTEYCQLLHFFCHLDHKAFPSQCDDPQLCSFMYVQMMKLSN